MTNSVSYDDILYSYKKASSPMVGDEYEPLESSEGEEAIVKVSQYSMESEEERLGPDEVKQVLNIFKPPLPG